MHLEVHSRSCEQDGRHDVGRFGEVQHIFELLLEEFHSYSGE